DRLDLVVTFPLDGTITALAWPTQALVEHMEGKRRGEGTWIDDIRHGASAKHIVAVLLETGMEYSAIGVTRVAQTGMATEGYFPFTTWSRIVEGLPKATFRNFWPRYAPFMMTKSREELEVLKKAAAAGEAACAAILDFVRPGVTEIDIYAT